MPHMKVQIAMSARFILSETALEGLRRGCPHDHEHHGAQDHADAWELLPHGRGREARGGQQAQRADRADWRIKKMPYLRLLGSLAAGCLARGLLEGR